MISIRFHREARADYDEAYDWYAERSRRAADRFESAFQKLLDRIRESPASFPHWEEDDRLRFAVMSRFPYILLFSAGGEVITVVAVQHERRDPSYWQRRI